MTANPGEQRERGQGDGNGHESTHDGGAYAAASVDIIQVVNERLCLLTVHAHPADEASKGAPTLAMYKAQGVHTVLVCCTGGEEGDLQNPALREPGQPFHGLTPGARGAGPTVPRSPPRGGEEATRRAAPERAGQVC